MKHPRLSLLGVGACLIAGMTLSATAATAATTSPQPGGCSVSMFSPMTPQWSVTCSHPVKLVADTIYDAQHYQVNPVTVHENESFSSHVAAGGTWAAAVAIPGLFYMQDDCTTLRAGSGHGPTVASTCFTRAPLPSTGEPPTCGVQALSGLPIGWTAGCGSVGGTITATGSYRYVSITGCTKTEQINQSMTLASWQTWSGSVPLPKGAVLTKASVKVTGQPAGSSDSYTIGTVNFHLG